MQDGVSVVSGFLVQALEGFRGGQNDQFDSSLVSFTLHIVHNGKGAVESVANDQLTALPGNLLFGGERGVAEFAAIFSGGFLLPFLDLSPIDDHVVLVRLAVDLNRAERVIPNTHGHLVQILLPTAPVCNSRAGRYPSGVNGLIVKGSKAAVG